MAYFKKVDKRATLKEARIRELTVAALAMLEEGWSEEKVEEELRRTAIYLWAPSYNTLKGLHPSRYSARTSPARGGAEAGRRRQTGE
jgi:hypothetical protein